MNASVFLSRVRRDRKGRSDRIADCQNWQDINSENAVNEIEAIETSVEVVDGRQKVHYSCLIVTSVLHKSPPLHEYNNTNYVIIRLYECNFCKIMTE